MTPIRLASTPADSPAWYVLNFSEAVRLHPRHGPKSVFLLVGATDESLFVSALSFADTRFEVQRPILVAFGEGQATRSRDDFKKVLHDQTQGDHQDGRFIVLRNVDQAPSDVLGTITTLLDTGFAPLARGGLLDLRAYHVLLTASVPYEAVRQELTSRVICPAFFRSQPLPLQPAGSPA